MTATISQFLRIVEAYAGATGLAESTVAMRIFSNGNGIARLRDGRDIGVRTMQEKLDWLSGHWPDGAVWPEDVPRPFPTATAAALPAISTASGET